MLCCMRVELVPRRPERYDGEYREEEYANDVLVL